MEPGGRSFVLVRQLRDGQGFSNSSIRSISKNPSLQAGIPEAAYLQPSGPMWPG